MALQGKTNLNTIGSSVYILVPYIVSTDDRFPFKSEDVLILKVKGKKVIVEKQEETENGTTRTKKTG